MMCFFPYILKDTGTPVPCGKCPACLSRRASGWSFRLRQQEKVSTSAQFLTLTYNTAYVPITDNGYMTLDKKHVQLYMKRLRKVNKEKLKYYTCGEYGGRTMRPHYHQILFNADVKTIQDAWQYGSVYYGTVTGASIGYCLKYMCKSSRVPLHRNDDRLPEFSLMSKGLGVNYLSPAMVNWHRADINNRTYIKIEDGKRISIPRYYRNKIYSAEEQEYLAYVNKERMVDKVLEEYEEFAKQFSEDVPEKWQQAKFDRFQQFFLNAKRSRDRF